MSDAGPAARLLHHRPFVLFFSRGGVSRFAVQIATVALGWQVYAMTDSAFALGMIGLAQFLPTALLVFFAGHAADRYERRRLLQSARSCRVAPPPSSACGTSGAG